MKKLEIDGHTGYSRIYINESISKLSDHIGSTPSVIITDEHVFEIYGKQFPDIPVIKIGRGESIKTLATVDTIYHQLLDLGIDRHSLIVGIGGGIVCDITGFAASTFMRGIPFGFVSSTLLSQVDASVGGKNGVNLQGYKNMVGMFRQPQFVICDLGMLKTLPRKELSNGFAELIKHTLIGDGDLFRFMEQESRRILSLDPDVMEKLIFNSINIKADIVRQDETETGIRKKLNFGHTFGHALEKTQGIPHGEAVSIGMIVAARLSRQRGTITPQSVQRIMNLLTTYSLPIETPMEKNEIIRSIMRDKKKDGDHVDFVLLESIGDVSIQQIKINDLGSIIDDMSGSG